MAQTVAQRRARHRHGVPVPEGLDEVMDEGKEGTDDETMDESVD